MATTEKKTESTLHFGVPTIDSFDTNYECKEDGLSGWVNITIPILSATEKVAIVSTGIWVACETEGLCADDCDAVQNNGFAVIPFSQNESSFDNLDGSDVSADDLRTLISGLGLAESEDSDTPLGAVLLEAAQAEVDIQREGEDALCEHLVALLRREVTEHGDDTFWLLAVAKQALDE